MYVAPTYSCGHSTLVFKGDSLCLGIPHLCRDHHLASTPAPQSLPSEAKGRENEGSGGGGSLQGDSAHGNEHQWWNCCGRICCSDLILTCMCFLTPGSPEQHQQHHQLQHVLPPILPAASSRNAVGCSRIYCTLLGFLQHVDHFHAGWHHRVPSGVGSHSCVTLPLDVRHQCHLWNDCCGWLADDERRCIPKFCVISIPPRSQLGSCWYISPSPSSFDMRACRLLWLLPGIAGCHGLVRQYCGRIQNHPAHVGHVQATNRSVCGLPPSHRPLVQW